MNNENRNQKCDNTQKCDNQQTNTKNQCKDKVKNCKER